MVPSLAWWRLWLRPEQLRMHNRLVIEYENTYNATGDGVHHFIATTDHCRLGHRRMFHQDAFDLERPDHVS